MTTIDDTQPLIDLPLVFFDVETTGLDLQNGHRICELAMLRREHRQITGQINTLINPERELDPQASQVNGIRAEDLQSAPRFAELAVQVVQLSQQAVRVAHNLPFDERFLNMELARAGYPPLTGPALDTLELARRLGIRRGSLSLGALATSFGLPTPTHRAMDDVLTLHVLFDRLVAKLADYGVTTLYDALRFTRGLLPGQPEPEAPPPLAAALASGTTLRIIYTSHSNPQPIERRIRPIELVVEPNGLSVRAFCYLRNDIRNFLLAKISAYLPDFPDKSD
ncbi:MAG: DNA polymerase III subunit epsilon [Chloroflexus sp.]|uniref:3'-5' exonuclease n=1 Tax=Chloroflexus sp. TaxID=1904827 RepID=UPI0021DF29B3|nr:exonuclease domain-containing protein [Chloroflexus sp.]GIV90168.1 MAG: DNA polymerase III subunit epsilon [Chloroflexus sp.]